MTIRIMVADDHKLMREGLQTLIAAQPDMRVVAEAADGDTAIQCAEKESPDILIMDISMPGMNGIEATGMITAKKRSIRVIALSMHVDMRMTLSMFEAGAAGYLLKDCAFQEVITAIQAVSSGGIYISSRILQNLAKEYSVRVRQNEDAIFGQLSKRDQDILRMLTEGRTVKMIGHELKMTQKATEDLFQQVILDHVVPALSSVLNVRVKPDRVTLTAREKEILIWVKEGKNNWEIGSILDITQDTVKFHLKNIFQKLNVANRSQAIAAALEQKLIEL